MLRTHDENPECTDHHIQYCGFSTRFMDSIMDSVKKMRTRRYDTIEQVLEDRDKLIVLAETIFLHAKPAKEEMAENG